jgi:hypothetical protein
MKFPAVMNCYELIWLFKDPKSDLKSYFNAGFSTSFEIAKVQFSFIFPQKMQKKEFVQNFGL